jgi:hypothetical protein
MLRCLLLFAQVSLTSAPLPCEGVEREIRDLSREADEAAETAALLSRRFVLEPDLPQEQQAALQQRVRRATERAAQRYTRLARLLDSLDRPGPSLRRQADQASLKAAKAWFDLGDYEQSLGHYERTAARSSDPLPRAEALAGTVRCHAALGRPGELRRALALLREEIPHLSEQVRPAWECWAEEVDGTLKASDLNRPLR